MLKSTPHPKKNKKKKNPIVFVWYLSALLTTRHVSFPHDNNIPPNSCLHWAPLDTYPPESHRTLQNSLILSLRIFKIKNKNEKKKKKKKSTTFFFFFFII